MQKPQRSRPVTGSELLMWTKWELLQLIKRLAADRTPEEIRTWVDELRQDLNARALALHAQGKRKQPYV